MKTCTRCHIEKDDAEYTTKDGRVYYQRCKECRDAIYIERKDNGYFREKQNAHFHQARRRNSQILLEYLSTHHCVDCGESDPVVLQFDHLPGCEKKQKISKLRSSSVKTMMDEIAKCEVVCANCHIKRTEFRNPGYKTFMVWDIQLQEIMLQQSMLENHIQYC